MTDTNNEMYAYIALGLYGLFLLVADSDKLVQYSILSKKMKQSTHRQMGIGLMIVSFYLLNQKYKIVKFKL